MNYTAPDLTNCDQEPIHIIGKIQSYAYLLALDKENLDIKKASANIEDLIGSPASEIIDQSIDQYFSFSFLEYLQELVHSREEGEYGSLSFEHRKSSYILSVHESDGLLVLEIEREHKKTRQLTHFQYADLVESLLSEFGSQQEAAEICHTICLRLRKITGFNRVMAYRFDENDNGEVIAEVKDKDMAGYLGLKFPSTDIPAQARRLYLQSSLRGIYDVEDEPTPLYPPEDKPGVKPLDLSNSFLRSVSPIHITYLKNMGVRASFSISVVVKGKLWGMILCHHTREPIKLDIHQRRACRFIGKMLSQKIEMLDEDRRFEIYKQQRSTLRKTVRNLVTTGDFHAVMEQNQAVLMDAFDCDAYALQYRDKLQCHPDLNPDSLHPLIDYLLRQDQNIFYTDNLKENLPQDVATDGLPPGLLAIRLSRSLNEILLLFRHEQVRQVKWAGKPESDPSAAQKLSPRSSFEEWTQTVKGESAAWTEVDISFAEELRMQLIESMFSLIEDENFYTEESFRKRATESILELQEANQQLRLELESLRKRESSSRWQQNIDDERRQAGPLQTLSKKGSENVN